MVHVADSQRFLPGLLFSKTSARADSQKRRSPVPFGAILSDHSNQDEKSDLGQESNPHDRDR
jgi:hypothetical protein